MSTESLFFSVMSGLLYAALLVNHFDWMNEQACYIISIVLMGCLVGMMIYSRANYIVPALVIAIGFFILGLLVYIAFKTIIRVYKYGNLLLLLWIIPIGIVCLTDIIIIMLKYNSTTYYNSERRKYHMDFNNLIKGMIRRHILSDIVLHSVGSGIFLGLMVVLVYSLKLKELYPINVLLFIITFLVFMIFIGLSRISINQFLIFRTNAKSLSTKLIIGTSLLIVSFIPIIKISGILTETGNAYYSLFYIPIILFWIGDISYMINRYMKFK